jgi:hypothetical protein
VREEDGLSAALDQVLRLTAQEPKLDEPFGDDQRRGAMDVAPLDAGGAARGRLLGRADDREDLLRRGEPTSPSDETPTCFPVIRRSYQPGADLDERLSRVFAILSLPPQDW